MNNENVEKEQKRALITSSLGLSAQSASTMLLSFVLSSMMITYHISGAAGGLISTITNIGMLVGGIFFGPLADKYGRVKIYSITTILYALATGLMAFSPNIFIIYILRFIVGIGGGGVYGVIMSMVADVYPQNKRGRINSYVTVAGQIGSIIAAIAAAIIIPMSGWRGLFLFGAIPIILGIFVYYKVPESSEWKKSQEKEESNSAAILSILFKKGNIGNTLRLMVMAIVQVAGYFGLMNWLPSILQEKSGLSVSGSSIWMIATIVGMSLGMLVFGQIMDRIGPKVAYSLFLLASAVSVFLYSFANNEFSLLMGGAIVGFFANGMNAGYGAIVGDLYETKIRATANNIIFNIGRAVGGFSAVVIGYLLDNFNLTITMGFLAMLYIISFFTVLTLNLNKRSENNE
ncbi:MFS transporter [Lactobacillus sp. YT155]|uniref:MFS transporter n=1 Tax=Lactobacillus sp. YT155 TaxID=3060955 RepID=UPI002660228B|nr:MFS transporter [Lactobacillus sp. YT155]MDO1605741.1 MFS transporter [Lactobacillus sp. YT155]